MHHHHHHYHSCNNVPNKKALNLVCQLQRPKAHNFIFAGLAYYYQGKKDIVFRFIIEYIVA
jgi:hypothetical protein